MRYLARLLIIVASLVCCADNARSQVSTAVVNFNFATLVQTPNRIQWLSLQTVPSVLNGTNYQGQIFTSVAQNPSLTNGFFSTNVVCGLIISGTWSDGYNTYTTNFYFPSSIAGGSVSAWQYVGLYNNQIPAFFYANQPSPVAAGNSGIGITNIGGTNFFYNLSSGGGGSATNALINGPGGIYDASLVTNVLGAHVVGAVAGALNATNLSGTVPAAQITGTIALSQLPTSIVTNLSTGLTSLGQFSISNSAYGGLAFQRTAVGNESSIDTFQGNFRFMPTTGAQMENFFPGVFPTSQQYPFYCYNTASDQNLYASAWNLNYGTGTLFKFMEFLAWTDVTHFPGSGFNNLPISVYGNVGGDVSGAEGMPPASPDAMAVALPVIPIQLTTFCEADETFPFANTNEFQCTNMLASVAGCGLLADITNAGGSLMFHHDATTCFFNPRRGVGGLLTLNLTNYPDGSNYAAVIHSFGAKLEATMYYYDYPTNEADINIYTGQLGSGYPAAVAITPNSRAQDTSKFYDFGLDAIRVADTGDYNSGTQLAWARKMSEDLLNPANLASAPLISLQSYGLSTARSGKTRSSPIAMEFFTPQLDSAPAELWPQINWLGIDQLTWNGYVNSPTQAVSIVSLFRGAFTYGAAHLGIGHYNTSFSQFFSSDYSIASTRLYLALDAAGLNVVQFGFNSTNSLVLARPNFLATVSNSAYLKAYFYPLCGQPKSLFDTGGGNNSVWYRQTLTGYEMALVNESAGPTNLTINLSAMGADPTKQWMVTDCWGTNNTGAPVTTTYGPYYGSFVFSNTPPTSAAFLVLTPAGVTGNGSGLTSLNASQLSSGTIPTARLPASVVTSIYSNVTTNQQQAYFTASHSIQLGGPGSNGDIDWWNDSSGEVEQMLMDGASGELQFNGLFRLTGIGNKFIGNGGGITNQGYARSLTSTNILWTPTVQSDGNTNWSGLITNTPAATITGQLPALNASALTSLNAANVSGVWAAPVVTNFAGSVTFSNLNVPNTTATLALLPSQVPNATQVTNMIAANASGGGGSGNVLSNTPVQFTQLTVTNGQLIVSNNIPIGTLDQQNTNTFAQPLVIQNLSGGASASSEVSVWADTGSSTNNFSSFGINNSGFNNSALPPVGPYTAYWLAQGNSTNWGTAATETIMIDAPQTNASINFSAGNGSTFTNAQISDSGLTLNRGSFTGNASGLTGGQSGLISFTSQTNTEEFAFGLTNNLIVATNLDGVIGTIFDVVGRGSIFKTNFIATPAGTNPVYSLSTNGNLYFYQQLTNTGFKVIRASDGNASFGWDNTESLNASMYNVASSLYMDGNGFVVNAGKTIRPISGNPVIQIMTNITVSGYADITNGVTSFISNNVPLASFTIAGGNATTFFTNNQQFSVLVGFVGTTITGVGICPTNGGVTSQFWWWPTSLTGGTVPCRSGASISFTNGVTAGSAAWTPFP